MPCVQLNLHGFTECIDDGLVRNIPDDLLAVFIINKAVCLIGAGIGFDFLLGLIAFEITDESNQTQRKNKGIPDKQIGVCINSLRHLYPLSVFFLVPSPIHGSKLIVIVIIGDLKTLLLILLLLRVCGWSNDIQFFLNTAFGVFTPELLCKRIGADTFFISGFTEGNVLRSKLDFIVFGFK